ncbi:unnamed protein product [Dracunculus medinensis]|uniref:Sm domain-containing protein n=1 Tax=Dracunculus medinensis TaxID=318479 RepID=A0A3P7PUN0_DRAME|nr:unnamed protein product [Dracunculus medinensis]
MCRVEESDLFSSYSNQHAIYSNKIKFKEKDDSSRKKKGSIVNLARFIDKKIRVKFQGGREVKPHPQAISISNSGRNELILASGILKGYDALINLVLDNAIEYVRDSEDHQKITEETRQLGLIVARGTAITIIAPNDGIEQIANPFV